LQGTHRRTTRTRLGERLAAACVTSRVPGTCKHTHAAAARRTWHATVAAHGQPGHRRGVARPAVASGGRDGGACMRAGQRPTARGTHRRVRCPHAQCGQVRTSRCRGAQLTVRAPVAAQEALVCERRANHAQLRALPHIRDEALQRLQQR
jgi:hypothetical protein